MICAEKSVALQHISRHLVAHGSKKWKGVRANFPTISESSFWRFVREAKAQMGEQNLADTMEKSLSACELVDRSEAIGSSAALGGPDYLAALRSLYRDTMMLRTHALNADQSVRNPAVLDRSIRTRLKLLAQAVRLERQIQDLVCQNFFNAVVDEVAAEAPGAAHRIIERLRRLSKPTTS